MRDLGDGSGTREARETRETREMRGMRELRETCVLCGVRKNRPTRAVRELGDTRERCDIRERREMRGVRTVESMRAMSAGAEQAGRAAVATSECANDALDARSANRRPMSGQRAAALQRGSDRVVYGVLRVGAQRPDETPEARLTGACREWLPALVLQVIDRRSQRGGRESGQRQPRSPVHGVAGAFEYPGVERHADRDRPRGTRDFLLRRRFCGGRWEHRSEGVVPQGAATPRAQGAPPERSPQRQGRGSRPRRCSAGRTG
jgi:hypothetical protein